MGDNQQNEVRRTRRTDRYASEGTEPTAGMKTNPGTTAQPPLKGNVRRTTKSVPAQEVAGMTGPVMRPAFDRTNNGMTGAQPVRRQTATRGTTMQPNTNRNANGMTRTQAGMDQTGTGMRPAQMGMNQTGTGKRPVQMGMNQTTLVPRAFIESRWASTALKELSGAKTRGLTWYMTTSHGSGTDQEVPVCAGRLHAQAMAAVAMVARIWSAFMAIFCFSGGMC